MAKKRKSKSGKNRSQIHEHKRQGNQLVPPFVSAFGGKLQTSSWINDRLPEMLWAALMVVSDERSKVIRQFWKILDWVVVHERKEELADITLTGISQLDPTLRDEIIKFIVSLPAARDSLDVLKLFESLPAREAWLNHLSDSIPDASTLMNAVGAALWHQSREATDCRWVKLMAQVGAGKFRAPKEFFDILVKYGKEGHETESEGFVRSAEMAHNPKFPADLTWPKSFWLDAWKHTPCFELVPSHFKDRTTQVTRQRILDVADALKSHWGATHSTTAIDARHDAIFGMVFYSLRILEEMMGIGIGTSVLGRLGLRTILETRINLRYLLMKDELSLWKKWREYGAGQAKLNALKFDEVIDPPQYIEIDKIEAIAAEDIWEELLPVNLASWSGLDLRKISEHAGLKNTYDKYYSWASGYSHGTWGAVRESCYSTCGNPLHRLHRHPRQSGLGDAINDAVSLVDEIISELNFAFPSFSSRLVDRI